MCSKQAVGKKIAEGKTKTIFETTCVPAEVLIRSKDDITAGDGAKRDELSGKGALANETTCNCFQLLHRVGISTHFIDRIDDQTFRAQRLSMIPVELVARRIATGSCLKRRPDVPEGHRFDSLVLEFFAKDDEHHDPLVVYDFVGKRILQFNAKRPLSDGVTNETSMGDTVWLRETFVPTAIRLLANTFTSLEAAWARQNVTLVDLKIECCVNHINSLVVGDVIDNDSWRIWPEGDKAQMVDKQVYRDLPASTPEALKDILAKYTWVAEATKQFLN